MFVVATVDTVAHFGKYVMVVIIFDFECSMHTAKFTCIHITITPTHTTITDTHRQAQVSK